MAKQSFRCSFLPSEETVRTLSRPEKIAYLNRWLMKARVVMYTPGLLLIAFCIIGAMIVKDIPYTQMLSWLTLLALMTPLLLFSIVVNSTKSRLKQCIHSITEEAWTDISDLPLLLQMFRQQMPIPYASNWLRKQLAHTVILHGAELTQRDKTEVIRIFSFNMQNFMNLSRSEMPLFHERLELVPLLCEATAEIGGRNEAKLMRFVQNKAIAIDCPAEMCESVGNSLARLEARLAREEAPDMLLRAGQMPDDGLLRAASNPQASSPETLLRASGDGDG